MTNQQKIEEFMIAAKQSIPEVPTYPTEKIAKLRAMLVLEEALELIVKGLGVTLLRDGYGEIYSLQNLLSTLKDMTPIKEDETNLLQLADGIADLEYVSTGTASACGIKMQPIFDEVHRSNMTKSIDGTFREDGKYVKGPNYSKADIQRELDRQMKLCTVCGKSDPQNTYCPEHTELIPCDCHVYEICEVCNARK